MASPTNLTRSRTHTSSNARSLELSGELPANLPRRKSAGSLSIAGRILKASATSSSTAPTTPSIPPGPWSGESYFDAVETIATAATISSSTTKSKATKKQHTKSSSRTKPLPTPTTPTPPVLPELDLPPDSRPRPDSPVLRPSSPTNTRDSFISIIDDPFFQRFHGASSAWLNDSSAHSALLDRPLPPNPPTPPEPSEPPPDRVESRHAPPPPPPKSRLQRESLIINTWSKPSMEAVNIAVIGANGVGKTAFIQRALRLPRPPTTNVTAIRMEVEGVPHLVALIELDLEYFDVDPTQKINWPRQINGHMIPRIDGALILYDVMNKDSIRELPHTLSALHNSGLPTILVATKCDNPESTRQISVDGMAKAFPTIIADFKTAANVSANTRDCLQSIILASVCNRKDADKSSDPPAEPPTRKRAASSAAHLDVADRLSGRTLTNDQGNSRHSRASSEISISRTAGAGAAAATGGGASGSASRASRSPRVEYSKPHQSATFSFRPDMNDGRSEEHQSHNEGHPASDHLHAAQATFLDIEESDAESFRYSEDNTVAQSNGSDAIAFEKAANFEKAIKMQGCTFEELVSRLLSPPMNRNDRNYIDIFLCLYREFAAPYELMTAIIRRLNGTFEDKTVPFLERTATQFRMIEVIASWVSMYPGDFARRKTRQELEKLMRRLSEEAVFAVASQQIRDHLDNDVVEDDDRGWGRCDEGDDDTQTRTASIASSGVGTPGAGTGSDALGTTESMQSLKLNDSRSSERRLSSDLGSAAGASTTSGSGVAKFQFHSHEDYEREAATMAPTATLPLNKFRYHIFMNLDSDDIADEITRIDWIMFSSIRVRDFVRHVSLPLQEKLRCRSLKNINRMVNHFNHVAKWVANMILIRDKAKHRGPCLQKFMLIALRLRQLNNYNGLAAVLAGINGTAIHRLAQTRALVDADVQKRFARLVILMGTQKGHFAYRLAWENSPPPRIPFIPLHRKDLVIAEEGNPTFVDPEERLICWKKYEILTEVLMPIIKGQATPYPNLKKHEISRELILDCRMPTDDEEIYQRSVQVEPAGAAGATGGGGMAEAARKKFPWLSK